MIRLVLLTIFSFTFLFSNTQNISLLNDIKKVIQKEEYISLAINKYIVDNKEIPKTTDDDGNIVLDWNKLTVSDYLGTDFNKINPYTQKEMDVYFVNGFAFIRGAIKTEEEYKDSHKFLYNYYVNQVNRVLTQAPKTNNSDDLLKGTFVKYDNLQKQIVKILIAYENDNTLPSINQTSTCTKDEKFYELVNSQLILKYCEEQGISFDVYSNGENLVINDEKYLDLIQAPIGAKAYVKNVTENKWYEYYYQGSVETKEWIKREITGAGDTTNTGGTTDEFGTVGVVPGEKILVLREDIGCYLVGGDISCWGDNSHNKFGINTTNNPDADIIRTPIMLKNEAIRENFFVDYWDNNHNRIKYKSLAINKQNICAISIDNSLYCSGSYSSTSYMKKIYNNIISVAMTDTVIAIVDTSGNLYTMGVNLAGSLGINSSNEESSSNDFSKIDTGYKEVYSLSGTKTFGAVDTNNNFWIWGQRSKDNLYKPTSLDSSIIVDEVYINSSEFIIKTTSGDFYKTKDLDDAEIINNLENVKSITLSKKESDTQISYINNDNGLISVDSELITCKNYDETSCPQSEDDIFANALKVLSNTYSNISSYGEITELGLPIPKLTFEGAVFNGNSNVGIEIQNTEDFNITGKEFTLTVFVTPEDDNSYFNYIVSNGGGYGADGFQLLQKDDGIRFEINHKAFDVNNVLISGKKSFIVVLYNGTEIKIYVDGVLVLTSNFSEDIGAYYNNVEVGGNPFRDNYDFTGEISDLRIYDEVLDINQINSVYSNESSTSGTFQLDTTFTEWSGISVATNTSNPSNGDDIIYINGSSNNDIKLKNGDDQLEINGNANREVKGENGDDKIKINGDTNDKIDLGNDNNELVINGNLNKELNAGNGNDLITIKKSTNDKIKTDNGDDKIQIFGNANKEIKTGNGNDDIHIEGDLNDKIDTENDNDRIVIKGNVNKKIELGNGDDIIQVEGYINDYIDGQNGTNSIYLKKFTKSEYESNSTLKNRLKNFDNFLFKDGQIIGDDSVFGGMGNSGGDDVEVSTELTEKNKFICLIAKVKSNPKLFCWGHLANRLPLLSTSLYKDSKISTQNDYLYNKTEDKNIQRTYDQNYYNGNIFLKYPTYISGFDYDFKFR